MCVEPACRKPINWNELVVDYMKKGKGKGRASRAPCAANGMPKKRDPKYIRCAECTAKIWHEMKTEPRRYRWPN
jgi:hypothetical protein